MTDPGPAGAEIFRRCRDALRLSQAEIAAALHVSGGRTVRRWELGERPIPGPVWVALRYMMREHRERELAGAVEEVLRWRAAA